MPGVQFRLDHVVFWTQSPEGLHAPGSEANDDQPPLAGHPKGPQFSPNSQFLEGCDSPLTSVHGNALQQVGGPTRQGFCVCWLW